MSYRIFSSLMLSLLCSSLLLAQEVGVGQWRDHLPYRTAIMTAEGDEFVWAATNHSIFAYNKLDNSLERMSKIWGLSDVGVSAIQYHESTKTLLIGYSNGNLDLLSNGQIFNLAAIRISNVLGDKVINNFTIINDFAYLSCGFGIVVVDVARKEVKDTYYIGEAGALINVTDIATDGSTLYAASTEGLYVADLNNANLTNFTNWSKDETVPKPNAHFNEVEVWNNSVLLNETRTEFNGDTLFVLQDTSWSIVEPMIGNNIHSIELRGNNVLMAVNGRVSEYASDWSEALRIFDYGTEQSPNPQFALPGRDGVIWIADRGNGLVRSKNEFDNERLTPQGPFNSDCVAVEVFGSTVVVAAGALNGSLQSTFSQEGVFFFRDNEWSWFNNLTSQEYQQADVRDIVDMAVDPADEQHVFLASYRDGVIETQDGQWVAQFDPTNTPMLPDPDVDSSEIEVSDIQFDIDGNMWVAAATTPTPLSVRTASGDWYSYDLTGDYNPTFTSSLMINQDNYKWIAMPRGGGILVYDDNRTPENPNDDQFKQLTAAPGEGNLPSTSVKTLAEGLDGEIWIGTDEGIGVIFTPSNIFGEGDFDAQQITVTVGGFTGYLLESETVTAIAIDGQNRKWVGTENAGVFLLSPDGTEQVHHFTEENSPLLSNTVLDVAIDHTTGEVYFGTQAGLTAYRGSATAGNANYDDIYAFPNPVEPGYAGTIAIAGLKRDTDVKITDISGNLVFQTLSEGGQAVWDGTTITGEPVATGVYLVFCADLNGRDRAVTKILVVR